MSDDMMWTPISELLVTKSSFAQMTRGDLAQALKDEDAFGICESLGRLRMMREDPGPDLDGTPLPHIVQQACFVGLARLARWRHAVLTYDPPIAIMADASARIVSAMLGLQAALVAILEGADAMRSRGEIVPFVVWQFQGEYHATVLWMLEEPQVSALVPALDTNLLRNEKALGISHPFVDGALEAAGERIREVAERTARELQATITGQLKGA